MTNIQTNAPEHRAIEQQNDCSPISDASPDLLDISDKLLAARISANALSTFPGSTPTNLLDAYCVQQRSLDRWPDQVSGWKVGGIPPEHREALGADWLIGPIFKASVNRGEAGSSAAMPVFDGGFAAIEPELVVQLGNCRAEDRMFIGAEIASSPVPAINGHGPTAVVCDFGNNNGLLIGAEISGWQSLRDHSDVSIWINDALIANKKLTSLASQARPALNFCLEHFAKQGRKLAPGTYISTGAITGIHEAESGAKSRISFGELGVLHLHLTSAQSSDCAPDNLGLIQQ